MEHLIWAIKSLIRAKRIKIFLAQLIVIKGLFQMTFETAPLFIDIGYPILI